MHEQPGNKTRTYRGTIQQTLLNGVNYLLVVAVVVAVICAAWPLLHTMPKPDGLPSTMENVDWTHSESSIYCLACHKQVAPAMASLDVRQGHSHNVALTPEQAKAVELMGTIAGPDSVLICMSCHKLGQANPHMLADSLEDSKLCRHCHPEQFTAIGGKHDLRTTAPDEKNRFGQTAHTGGPCSACHLSHHYAREFEPSRLDPDGRCITCHKIGRAAAKLARETMEHPDSHCVVCHNPHDDTNQHFLKKPGAKMCEDCHENYAHGPTKGMHPVGAMNYDVPKDMIDAGAQVFGRPRELTCLVCHSTHSATHKPLLIMPADTNQLCLSCHEKSLAAKTADGKMPRHGQSPKLTAEQRAVVEGRGARVGADGELLCVSCHKMHQSEPDSQLLVFRPNADDGCTACHPNQSSVTGTVHDLRISAPQEKNLAGTTAREGGVCSACHMAHGSSRVPGATGTDVFGHCTTCHQSNGCAQSKLEGAPGHPGTNCIACHDPHQGSGKDFLTKDAANLCKDCHADQYTLIGGPHDPAANPAKWDKVAADKGPCAACHVTHGAKGSGLFSRSTTPDSDHDSMCLTCHQQTDWGANTDLAAIHPRRISPEQKRVPVSLVPTDDKRDMRMGCRTCHNPHGGAEPIHLARVSPGEPTANLCTHCHEDKKLIEATGHATAKLAGLGFDVDSCKPCHAMHANPSKAWGQMLSPRFLNQVGTSGVPTTQPALNPEKMLHEAAVPCLVCHHEGGPAPVREISTHPPVAIVNTFGPDAPGYMPLFNDDGHVDPSGQITCRTCHLSHGRSDLLRASASLSADEQRSARMQLRPFVAPNLCTQCHGVNGRLKFLFYHNTIQRKTPT